jgi:hypothetical protein
MLPYRERANCTAARAVVNIRRASRAGNSCNHCENTAAKPFRDLPPDAVCFALGGGVLNGVVQKCRGRHPFVASGFEHRPGYLEEVRDLRDPPALSGLLAVMRGTCRGGPAQTRRRVS